MDKDKAEEIFGEMISKYNDNHPNDLFTHAVQVDNEVIVIYWGKMRWEYNVYPLEQYESQTQSRFEREVKECQEFTDSCPNKDCTAQRMFVGTAVLCPSCWAQSENGSRPLYVKDDKGK